MKKLLLKFLIVILFFPFSLSAVSQKEIEQKCEKAVSLAKEYSNIQLMNELSELHVFLLENRISEAPYCSKIIIEKTEKLDNEKSSIAAQFAADISPSKSLYSFTAAKKIIKSDIKQIKKAFLYFENGFKQSFYSEHFETHILSVIKLAITTILGIFLIFISAIFIKNRSALIHRFMHITSFSKFYMIFLIVIFIATPVILFISTSYTALAELVLIALIWQNIRTRDKTISITIILISLFLDITFITLNENIITSKTHLFSYSTAVSPDDIKVKQTHYSAFYKALKLYYAGNYKSSIDELTNVINNKKSERELITAAQNLTGLNLYFSGELKAAKVFLNTLYSTKKESAVATNIAKIMEEEGLRDDADAIRYTISKRGFIATFPALYFPPSNKIVSEYKQSKELFIKAAVLSLTASFIPFILIAIILLFLIKLTFPSIKISRCTACGKIICEICSISRDSKHCMKCYMAKQSSHSLYNYDLAIYKKAIEKYSKNRKKLALSLAFIPSWGMIYLGRTIRSIFWLFLIVFPAILSFMTSKNTSLILIAVSLIFYIASIIRTYKIADKQK